MFPPKKRLGMSALTNSGQLQNKTTEIKTEKSPQRNERWWYLKRPGGEGRGVRQLSEEEMLPKPLWLKPVRELLLKLYTSFGIFFHFRVLLKPCLQKISPRWQHGLSDFLSYYMYLSTFIVSTESYCQI